MARRAHFQNAELCRRQIAIDQTAKMELSALPSPMSHSCLEQGRGTMSLSRPPRWVTVIWTLVILCSCQSGEHFDVAKVKGKVLCNGKPVPGGIVTFSVIPKDANPISGKAASGEIQPDGTFVMSTFSIGDGAILGKHRVSAGTGDPENPWPFKLSEPIEYEVIAGSHEIVIEVMPDGTGKITAGNG
jgi:hypothetical protein